MSKEEINLKFEDQEVIKEREGQGLQSTSYTYSSGSRLKIRVE